MKLTKETKTYNFDLLSNYSKSCQIVFVKESNNINNKWCFLKCDYSMTEYYNLKDWELLGEMNDKIHEIERELNKS